LYHYTSKPIDPEVQLYYYGARYYDPRTSVWQSADVVLDGYLDGKSKGGVYNSANLQFYGYAYQNPVRYTDPNGKWVETAWDVFNIGLGVASFADNVSQGNYLSAAIDAAGVAVDTVAAVLPVVPGGVGASIKAARATDKGIDALKTGDNASAAVKAGDSAGDAAKSVGELRAAGKKDAHHTIQDAAVRDVPGYDTNAAPGVQLPGPSTRKGTPHQKATSVQRQAGGGTYGAERRIGYKALRQSGMGKAEARAEIQRADEFFGNLGVTKETPLRIPGNRPNAD
jgi:RHS repeat-associated protein